jgi:hypothetical protein
MYKIGFWVLLLIVIAGLVGGAYYYGQQSNQEQVVTKIEEIKVPFDSILEFSDPSEDFVLQFEISDEDFGMLLTEELENGGYHQTL